MRQLLLLLCLITALPVLSQEAAGPRFARSRVMPNVGKTNAITNAKMRSECTVGLTNQLSRDTIGANELHHLDVTGKGVVICVVDVGIDFNHKAFIDEAGVNHVKRAMIYPEQVRDTLWLDEGHTAWRWNYQLAQTPQEISLLTTDSRNEVHGTHTSTSAGGARHKEGSENAEFYGMAPDADLFLVGNPSLNVEYTLDAFQHAKEYAHSVGKPLVCSYSVGDPFMPIDTLEYWPQALRRLTDDGKAPGIAVCVSAGNSGSPTDLLSLHWDMTKADAELEHKTVLGHPAVRGKMVDYTNCYYMFYDVNDRNFEYQLSVMDATKDTVVWQSEVFSTERENELNVMENTPFAKNGMVYISGGEDPDNHLRCVYIQSVDFKLPYKTAANEHSADTCYVLAVNIVGEKGGYIEGKSYPNSQTGEGFSAGTKAMKGYEAGDPVNALNSYCANPWCISVGASDATRIGGDYAVFSSYGYDFYGNPYPEVLAPGMHIISAVNRYNANPSSLTVHQYRAISGTSMSTPITAGMIACWMQENPQLTTRQIHDIIARTSYIDPRLAGAAPDASRYGRGTIQGKAAWDMVRDMKHTALKEISQCQEPDARTYNLNGIETNSQSGILIRDNKVIIGK